MTYCEAHKEYLEAQKRGDTRRMNEAYQRLRGLNKEALIRSLPVKSRFVISCKKALRGG